MADFMDDFLEPHTNKPDPRSIWDWKYNKEKVALPYIGGMTRLSTSDMYDSLLYSFQKKLEQDTRKQIETYFFNTEENNMKRTNNNEETRNFEIVRKYTTERGIFTVEQLDPTDMFALIDDEEQTVYMAVNEDEPKYKTKKAVVNMQTGDLLYLDIITKIHVYRPGSSELRVGEFLYSSKDYK